MEADYTALYANLEPAQAARGDVAAGMRTIISGIAEDARRYLGDQRPREWVDEMLHGFGPHGALRRLLSRWSEENDCVRSHPGDAMGGEGLCQGSAVR